MAIDSVSGASSAAVTASRQTEQPSQVEERRQAQARQEAQQQEAPKPVKNAEGQTTGSVVNVTA